MNRIREDWKTFKVEVAKLPTKDGKHIEKSFITNNGIPFYIVNSFIDGCRKASTGETYAYSLVKYLNYLNLINKTYDKARTKNIEDFIQWEIYGYDESLKVINLEGQLAYSTVRGDVSTIREFYRYLITHDDNVLVEHKNGKKKVSNNSFYYGQIYEADYIQLIDNCIENMKGTREYIKWYSEEQKDAILSNLKTLRDKAIFLIQLEGFRIDEALSLKLFDYNQFERTITPSRSKGLKDVNSNSEENTMRTIALNKKTAEILDAYILTERTTAENESNYFCDYIFINLRKGKTQGKEMDQDNYRKILKCASKRAGLNPEKIRTHSGRSTKAEELVEEQIKHPEKGITDIVIQETMGWKSLESLKHYKKGNSMVIATEASKKIHGGKQKTDDEKVGTN